MSYFPTPCHVKQNPIQFFKEISVPDNLHKFDKAILLNHKIFPLSASDMDQIFTFSSTTYLHKHVKIWPKSEVDDGKILWF